ncbi:MAG: metalloregulator ArsR/SmtB family transcription factor [Actinomycetaceae bacterium]|nr:metalloregulator ArsR/SmtB family transcription factor [Actinomycetaceae bacterium]
MSTREGAHDVARLFKALGNEARLEILCLLNDQELTVGGIAHATGLSQPLVSQHLRTLRDIHLVVGTRHGKEVVYSLADHHVAHVVNDAFTHVTEGHSHD